MISKSYGGPSLVCQILINYTQSYCYIFSELYTINFKLKMESEIVQYVNRADNAETEIQKLVKELEDLEKGVADRGSTKPVIDNSRSKSSNQGNFKATKSYIINSYSVTINS